MVHITRLLNVIYRKKEDLLKINKNSIIHYAIQMKLKSLRQNQINKWIIKKVLIML